MEEKYYHKTPIKLRKKSNLLLKAGILGHEKIKIDPVNLKLQLFTQKLETKTVKKFQPKNLKMRFPAYHSVEEAIEELKIESKNSFFYFG